MDNITHSLMGALLGQTGMKRVSRLAMAGCIMGANAPDIDVFAPLFLPVQGIAFHRGPLHGPLAWPVLAAGTVGLLALYNKLRPNPDAAPFRAWPLFLVTFASVLTHPFLDWLNSYAINLLAPFSSKWLSGDAIFIIDWVYWLLMAGGIALSWWRTKKDRPHPAAPARAACVALLAYIALNLGITARLEAATTDALVARGIHPTEVIASPPPFLFWRRTMLWRDATTYGFAEYRLIGGLTFDPERQPIGLDDVHLAAARARSARVRAFLYWSRMPIVRVEGGQTYLTDQRFAARNLRGVRDNPFLIPLD